MAEKKHFHWTDQVAERVIHDKGDKEQYTVAAGITPSGTVHIGNFREIITVDLVKRALEKKNKKVRFIYSWDNYDVFRKVPKNMPKQEELQTFLRKPIIDTPDTYGCHKSYAEHNQASVEEDVKKVGIAPEFLYQATKYRSGEYAEEIKHALEHNDTIKTILNQYRDEPLDEKWLPITMFCETCGKDTIKELTWLGGFKVKHACECGHSDEFDFKEKPLVKLKWRVDWPMRWHYEKVDFEPGGKDHSTKGGSFDTGQQIQEQVWKTKAPTYVMYNFINVKGSSGKMSSSSGEVVTLGEVLKIYEPEVVRWIFAGTRANREFDISFDADVIKVYEDFDKCERIYFGEDKVSENDLPKYKMAYELSCVDKIPEKMPYQPGFRHLTVLLQIHDYQFERIMEELKGELKNDFDTKRLMMRMECAKNWLETHAPDEFKFEVQTHPKITLEVEQKKVIHQIADKLLEKDWEDVDLHNAMYEICKENDFPPKDFFTIAYKLLIYKDRGPRLASFILSIGREKVAQLFKKA